VPTVTLRFPSNIPGLPGHNWSSAIAMATPIAHKGATAGAKVVARTALEMLLTPELVQDSWKYFREVQTKDMQYTPFIGPDDPPAIMAQHADHGGVQAEARSRSITTRRNSTRTSSSSASRIRP
jgi:hypothetical protein